MFMASRTFHPSTLRISAVLVHGRLHSVADHDLMRPKILHGPIASIGQSTPYREDRHEDEARPPEYVANGPVERRHAANWCVGEQRGDRRVIASGLSDNAAPRVARRQHPLVRGADDAEALLDATENGDSSVILAVASEVPCGREHRVDA